MKETDWFETVQLDRRTYLLRERLDIIAAFFGVKWVNSYLLVGSEKAALVDTGMGLCSIRAVVRELTALPVVVLNTHGHWDHVGGNWEYDERLASRIEAATMAEDVPLPFVDEALERTPELTPRLGLVAGDGAVVKGTRPTQLIEDGSVVSLGDRRIEVFEVPGHSPGHLAFLDRGERYLATGDAAYEGTMYAQLADGDPEAFAASLARLADMEGIERCHVLPGHGRSPLPGSIIPELAHVMAQVCEDRIPWEPWKTDPSIRRYYEGRLGALITPTDTP